MARSTVPAQVTVTELTVVVICYNDRGNLPRAIRSVQRQTLRNLEIVVVDDASTDGSADVAEELAQDDPRIRVIRLPENSGGCSAPRNAGIDAARGAYVMFLDSDDVYDRHACKTMLITAERTGADVVVGQVQRIHVNEAKRTGWYKRLFQRRAVYRGIRENPDLFFDPLSTNKLYRRELLDRNSIRFPVGVHYEDSLFSTKVYCHAQVIAVIPNIVYFWRVVRTEEDDTELSITQRRFEIQNFRDRIAVQRMMDTFMREHGFSDLKPYKDFKFIRHDLRLYLSDLPHRDPVYQDEVMRTAAEYLATVSQETLAMCSPVERICVHMIRRLDVTETLRTIDYLKFGYKLSTHLVERDGRVYWTERYLDNPDDREILDVTDLGLHRLPFAKLPLHNEVTALRDVGGRLRIEGSVYNQLARIPRDADLRLWVTARNRGRYLRRRVPVDNVRHEGEVIRYVTDVDLRTLLGPLDQDDSVWDARLELQWGEQVTASPFSVDPALVEGVSVRVRNRLLGAASGTVVPFVTTKLNLSFEQSAPAASPERMLARTNWLLNKTRLTVRWRVVTTLGHPVLKQRAYPLFQRLPVERGLAVFESHMGRQYSDSPRYIYEAAVAGGLDRLGLRPVWSHARRDARGFPEDLPKVWRGSWRYYWYLARAEFWVDNQGFPRNFTRRRETTYIQTWHGTPLKRMGFDSPALERASAATRKRHKAMMRRWSALLVPSQYFVDTFVKSFRYEGQLVRCGLPRNDLLVRGIDEERRRELRRSLNLPDDRRVVLYAPTFRDRDRRLGKEYKEPFDLDQLMTELQDEFHLAFRTHYLDDYKVSERYRTFATDVSLHHDVTELMLAADILVTDYSSVMFDFANTWRPMVFYVHDYEDYAREERGTYFDLAEEAPGPLVRDTDELIATLRDLDAVHERHRERYAAFREKFCEYETGHAADHVVKEFFERGRGA